jgi:hypothetical protein
MRLHDEAWAAPHEVDEVALDLLVDLRLRKPGTAAKREHQFFEVAAGACAAGGVLGEHPSQRSVAPPPGPRLDPVEIETEVRGLIEHALEDPARREVRGVDEGAGGGCDRDGLAQHHFVGR